MSDDESAVQRCPQCRCTFRVMADEQGTHPCPACGFFDGERYDFDADEREGREVEA